MRRHLIALALTTATPAAAEWREAKSDHFIIYSEQNEKALREFATKLERYDSAMRTLRQVPDIEPGPATRLTIYVVSGQAAVRRLSGGKDNFVAGFYVPRASGSIAIIPQRMGQGSKWELDAETVLLHEYAHHFLYQNYEDAYPAWFIEGYAEFHSTAKFEANGDVGLGMPANHRAYWLLSGNPLPIEKLLTANGSSLNSSQREALYGRGWLLTHFLTFEPKRTGQFKTYLHLINQGRSSIDAANSAFGDLKKLGKELDAYLVQRTMKYMKVKPAAIGAIQIRTLGRGEDAVMDAKIQSRRGVTPDQARALLPEIRRKALPFPNDPAVQATLAEAEYDAGYYAEADAAADRALAADAKNVDALIYKAMTAMELAAQSTDAKVWQGVRRLITAANRTDPSHATPLMLFYESFRREGVKPTPNSVVGLNSAYDLAPHDRDLRILAAHQFLVDGNGKEARRALAPIAYDPHADEAGIFAATIIGRIDTGDAAAALQAWDEARKETEKVEAGKISRQK